MKPPYTLALVYDDPPKPLPHSLLLTLTPPQVIPSISYIDLELHGEGSSLIFSPSELAVEKAKAEKNDDILYRERVVMPLRVATVRSAKWRKKRGVLEVDCELYTIESGFQPKELVDNVRAAQKQVLAEEVKFDDLKIEESTAKPQLTTQQLYDKYKKKSTNSTAKAQPSAPPSMSSAPPPPVMYNPPPATLSTIASKPSPTAFTTTHPPTPPPSTSSSTNTSTPSASTYDNTKIKVLVYPTNHLGLISPNDLLLTIAHLLQMASTATQPNANVNTKPETLKSILQTFPSPSQGELCRQLLVQAVPFADKTSSGTILAPDVVAKFTKLAEFQMRKIEHVLQTKYDAQLAANPPPAPTSSSAAANPHSRSSSHAHAPVFNASSRESIAQAVPLSTLTQSSFVVSNNAANCLSPLLLSNPKGSNKRIKSQTLKSKATKAANLLCANSFAVVDNFLDPQTVNSIRSELSSLNPHYTPSEIWVGKGSDVGAQITVPSIRGDKVLWMCGGHSKVDSSLFDSAGQQPRGKGAIEPCDIKIKSKIGTVTDKGGVSKISASVMGKFGTLKSTLESIDKFVFEELSKTDPRLARVSSRSDAMLAVYPGDGARFQRHVDNTAEDGRRLTVLLYLNDEGWEEKDGGMLRVWGRDEEDVENVIGTDVLPTGGRLAMFYSDKVSHEVTSSNRKRVAMTVWYYDSLERSEAVARANEMEKDKGDEKIDADAQSEASVFIKKTLAGAEGEGVDLEEELRQVGMLASKLNAKALKIVAGICGADSEAQFLEGARNMSKEGLQDLRRGLKRMGV